MQNICDNKSQSSFRLPKGDRSFAASAIGLLATAMLCGAYVDVWLDVRFWTTSSQQAENELSVPAPNEKPCLQPVPIEPTKRPILHASQQSWNIGGLTW